MRQVISALQHGAEPVKAVRDRIRDESRRNGEKGVIRRAEEHKKLCGRLFGQSFYKGFKKVDKGNSLVYYIARVK